jgi:hypothetical protein
MSSSIRGPRLGRVRRRHLLRARSGDRARLAVRHADRSAARSAYGTPPMDGPGRSAFVFANIVWLTDDDGIGPARMAAAFTRFAREGDRGTPDPRVLLGPLRPRRLTIETDPSVGRATVGACSSIKPKSRSSRATAATAACRSTAPSSSPRAAPTAATAATAATSSPRADANINTLSNSAASTTGAPSTASPVTATPHGRLGDDSRSACPPAR